MDAVSTTEVVENIQSEFSSCMNEVNAFTNNQDVQVELLIKKNS